MNDKEMIEEMAKLLTHIQKCGVNDNTTIAKYLLEKYQPKLSKDKVVLTKEEYNDLLNKDFTCFVGEQHKTDHCLYLEEAQNASKETAEKFAEDLINSVEIQTLLKVGASRAYMLITQKIKELAKQFGVEIKE